MTIFNSKFFLKIEIEKKISMIATLSIIFYIRNIFRPHLLGNINQIFHVSRQSSKIISCRFLLH